MTDKYTFFLTGKMIAEEPLTVTHKDAQVGKTHRLPRAGKGDNARPYWPASNIRGALRHAIATVAADASKAAGKPFSLDHHFMMAQGTDIAGAISDKDGVIDQHKELRAVNPALSLLGRWKLASKMDVGNGLPLTSDCVAYYGQGARRIMFEVNPDLVDELNAQDQERLKSLLDWQAEASGNKQDIKAQIKRLNDQMKSSESSAEKRLLKDQVEALKAQESSLNKGESEDGATGIRRPLPGYEAFNGGTEFSQKITLHNVTLVEAGLFIAGLAKFIRYPQLGAKSAHNNGKVGFDWDVLRYENARSLTPLKTGSITASFDKGISIKDPLLEKAYNAWCEVADNLANNGVDLCRLD